MQLTFKNGKFFSYRSSDMMRLRFIFSFKDLELLSLNQKVRKKERKKERKKKIGAQIVDLI